jgi:hypothetical protein
VVVNLIQNSFACYMKLSHYKEAAKCAHYIKSLMPDYLKTYLLQGQVAYFNKAATLKQVRDSLKQVKEGAAITNLAVANSHAYVLLLQ